jgi:hypothetical protein
MNRFGVLLIAVSCFLFPSLGHAQTTGRVECARSDGYVYLYSSMTTLDVRATLQCGQIVQISGRYETYFSVRTSKGDVGYIPIANLTILKDQVGTGLPQLSAAAPARERTPYDERPAASPAPRTPVIPPFTLLNGTPVHVRILKPLSSASAHVGDAVEFEVLDDVLLDDVVVIAKGAKASGNVSEVETKKHFGHDGKVSFIITSVRLTNNESAPVRCYHEVFGTNTNTPNSTLPQLSSGKDATIAQGSDFTAQIDGDIRLKRESFPATASKSGATPPSANPTSSQAH